jgi:hypothetical protein
LLQVTSLALTRRLPSPATAPASPRTAAQGAKRDRGRRQRAAELRARGLTLKEIGKRLGITKQGAAFLLKGST